MTGGKVLPECAISTSEGVKAADVAWCSQNVWDTLGNGSCFIACPELCIEVISPSNTKGEIEEKKRLYVESGAEEVWLCDTNGKMTFYSSKDLATGHSSLFPNLPETVKI